MVTYGPTGAWIYITDGTDKLYFWCQSYSFDEDNDPYIEPIPGDSRVSYNLEEYERLLVLEGVYFTSKAQYKTFREKLLGMNSSAFKVYIIEATGSYLEWNVEGTPTTWNDYIQCFYVSSKGVRKAWRGDCTIWKCDRIVFKQAV